MIGENKMKKALAIILSICFMLCLTACNKEGTSSEHQIGEPIHTHNFSNATCIQPKMCSCGAFEGEPTNHELVNGLCKYCSQAIIVNPKNIDFFLVNKNNKVRLKESEYFADYDSDIFALKDLFKNNYCGELKLEASIIELEKYDYLEIVIDDEVFYLEIDYKKNGASIEYYNYFK